MRPDVLCWSTRLRNELAQDVSTLVLPQAFTHDLACEGHSNPRFRRELVQLFADVSSLKLDDIGAFVDANVEEFESLALSFRENYGYDFTPIGGQDYTVFNRSGCILAYFTGFMMLPFAHITEPLVVLTFLMSQGVLEKLWFLLLHWTDIATTAWPVLKILEWFALVVHSRAQPEAVHVNAFGVRPAFDARPGDASANLWAAALTLGPREWMTLASRAMAPPATPFSVASAHLALVLAILDGRAEERDGHHAQWLLTAALSWLRAAPRRPPPPVQLVHSAWPVLSLWGRIWRHPEARRLLGTRLSGCPIAFDARWNGRLAITDGLAATWLAGRGSWRGLLAVEPPSMPLDSAMSHPWECSAAGQIPTIGRRGVEAPREAWASAVAFPQGAAAGTAAAAQAHAWVDAIRVLHASVRRHEDARSRRPFILVVDDDLDDGIAGMLAGDGIELRSGPPVDLPPWMAECSPLQRRAEGLRIRLWELVEFDRILYLDADMLVVGPLEHLFRTPSGVFLSATINGTRWAYTTSVPGQAVWDQDEGADSALGSYGRLQSGPPQLNTGIMLISPSLEFVKAVYDVMSLEEWEVPGGGWMDHCNPLLLPEGRLRNVCETGIFTAMCAQGLTDTIYLSLGRRLGDVAFAPGPEGGEDGEREFLGCKSPSRASGQALVQPLELGDHCTLDESYNFQATLPHLTWHMPHVQEFAQSGRHVRVVHWPGLPKPWTLAEGQRTAWDRLWWDTHTELCWAAEGRLAEPCYLRCA